jgi:hypothetical protein
MPSPAMRHRHRAADLFDQPYNTPVASGHVRINAHLRQIARAQVNRLAGPNRHWPKELLPDFAEQLLRGQL